MKKKDPYNRRKKVRGFQVVESECIWMKAGVVNFRLCDNVYDCNHCAFDKAMRKAMGAGTKPETEILAPRWVEYLQKKYQGASSPCRHVLSGRIEAPKICVMNYECYHCSFDQMLDEADLAGSGGKPDYDSVAGYKMARGYYYHMGHGWLRLEHGGRMRVGFDEFLVKLFGNASAIELPKLGDQLVQNRVGWAFRRGELQAAVLAPVSGTVLAINQNAIEHPEIVYEDPYHQGWLLMIEPQSPKKNLRGLYFGNESLHWMENESLKLLAMIGEQYSGLSATGGQVIGDVFGQFPELGWDKLVKNFLRTRQVETVS